MGKEIPTTWTRDIQGEPLISYDSFLSYWKDRRGSYWNNTRRNVHELPDTTTAYYTRYEINEISTFKYLLTCACTPPGYEINEGNEISPLVSSGSDTLLRAGLNGGERPV